MIDSTHLLNAKKCKQSEKIIMNIKIQSSDNFITRLPLKSRKQKA